MAAYEKQGKSDEWYTPKYIFDALGLKFSIDVAAPIEGPLHVPCYNWYHRIDNALLRQWYGTIWMNPPFGHQSTKRKWMAKFVAHGDGIALLPDRTSAPWWQEFAGLSDAVLFISPKVKFIRPDGSVGEQPGTGTTLFACGQTARNALIGASFLGSVLQPIAA